MERVQDLFLGNNKLLREFSGTTIALTGYDKNAEFEEWHTHKNNSISLLLSGTHEENIQSKHIKRLPGDLKFIPAGVLHRCEKYTPGTRKINLDLDEYALKNLNINEDHLSSLSGNSLVSKFTLLKLYHELAEQGDSSAASAELLLFELFNPAVSPKQKTKSSAPIWIAQLRDLLNDEWNSTFHLEDLAKRLGVHPVTISKYFPLYFSSTLGNFVLQIKVNRAIGMIKGSAISFTDIAYVCGFADQAHFTRTFKNITGYLPKEFRKI